MGLKKESFWICRTARTKRWSEDVAGPVERSPGGSGFSVGRYGAYVVPCQAGDDMQGGVPISKKDALIEALTRIADFLGEICGRRCEVVVHDLRSPQSSIVHIVNGHVTGRKVGGPVTDLALRVLRAGGCPGDRMVNYETRTADGKRLRSSTVFFRGDGGEIVACLCINIDLTDYLVAKQVLDEMCFIASGPTEPPRETFVESVSSVIQNAVKNAIDSVGKPVALMQKEDKVEAVRILDEAGMFLIKGAVDFVANELAVSRYTVYNYLEEVRSKRNIGPVTETIKA